MQKRSMQYLFLSLTIVSIVATLISIVVVFAPWNEIPLLEAINSGQVTADIRGTDSMGEGSSFQEPMLQITLQNQSYLPLRVVIAQDLTLEGPTGYANVVTLQTEKVLLFPFFSQSRDSFAYSLDYREKFPSRSSEYDIKADATISEELRRTLDTIIALESQDQEVSQLAVWLTSPGVELQQIEQVFGQIPQNIRDEVERIVKHDSAPPRIASDALLWGAPLILLLFTFGFGTLSWRSYARPVIEKSETMPVTKPTPGKKPETGLALRETVPGQVLESPAIDEPQDKLIDYLNFTDSKPYKTGGMAEVWIAWDTRQTPAQKVIVKFPKRVSISTKQTTINFRFDIEREKHQQLDHENIVKIIDSGQCSHPDSKETKPCLIQQFISGWTLKALLNKGAIKNESAILYIAHKWLDTLSYIHDQKIIHRDITLKNVMIDKSGEIYIIDFGNCAAIPLRKDNMSLTDDNGLLSFSTGSYCAPSNIVSRYMPAHDLYSLAVCIYALYGGELIQNNNPLQTHPIISERLQKLQGIPEWIREVLQRCLKGEYKDAFMLKRDLTFQDHYLIEMVKESMALNSQPRPKSSKAKSDQEEGPTNSM